MDSALIVQLGLFGDCLFATVIAKQIRHDFPNCKISWAIWSKYESILNNNPHVNEILSIDIDNKDYVSKHTMARVLKETNAHSYDKVYFSQIPNINWWRYDGCIRSSILSSYDRPFTVSVAPVMTNTSNEINNVKEYANEHGLANFKNVVLFECSPGSGQSKINFDRALKLSQKLVEKKKDTCFILSSPNTFDSKNSCIIDASTLSFRENAYLTHYCNLLIGCSSGLSWLSTSTGAKQINTLQLLSADYPLYTGMIYDAKKWGLPINHIIEMCDDNFVKIENCIQLVLNNKFETAKSEYNKEFAPQIHSYSFVLRYLLTKLRLNDVIRFTKRFYVLNSSLFTKSQLSKAFIKEILVLPILVFLKVFRIN